MMHMKAGPVNPKQRSRGRGPNGGGGGGGGGGGKKHIGGGGGGGGGGIPRPNQVFDSNGPECRIRGNAHQVLEKYLTLARDASLQGDRVGAENYYQHAEHYFRVINAQNQTNGRPRQQMPTPADEQSMSSEGDDEGNNDEQAQQVQPVQEIPGEGPQPIIEERPRPMNRPVPAEEDRPRETRPAEDEAGDSRPVEGDRPERVREPRPRISRRGEGRTREPRPVADAAPADSAPVDSAAADPVAVAPPVPAGPSEEG